MVLINIIPIFRIFGIKEIQEKIKLGLRVNLAEMMCIKEINMINHQILGIL